MAMHNWQGKPISHKDHHSDLERDSAALEFGASKLDRKAAEEAAYQGYRRKQHTDAAIHHLRAMRDAVSSGQREDGERHSALYGLHMKALGLNPNSTTPLAGSETRSEHKPFTSFRPHPSDHLLVDSHMKKHDRDAFFKYVDTEAAYLSEPQDDDTLSKALSSPLALEQLHGQRVKVYFNLHNRLFSVQHGGRVVAHLPEVALKDVNFRVQEAGRQRVLKDQRKNVHSYVEGVFEHKKKGEHKLLGQGVSYNPYKHSSFVRTHDSSPISKAPSAILRNVPHPTITVEEKQVPESEPSFIHTKGQNA